MLRDPGILTTKADQMSAIFSDVSIGDKKLSTILGELIWEEISQYIIHECLVHSVPNNSSELEKYITVRPQQSVSTILILISIL